MGRVKFHFLFHLEAKTNKKEEKRSFAVALSPIGMETNSSGRLCRSESGK